MRMPITAIAALLCATPLHARTIDVSAGPEGPTKLQEALIEAKAGDEVRIGAGTFALVDTLSLDVPGVTVRGAGMDGTVLDFTGQQGGAQGLLVTAAGITLRDFAVLNPKGDGIKSKGADNIVLYRLRVTWSGGPKASNGGYGIYPVESAGVLIDGVHVAGASDSGIYVGQSRDITVRNSFAEANVAGIEIENSRNALVEGNLVSRNTGGILIFDLPDLPVMGGGNTVVTGNRVVANDLANFAPPGNIVASVRRGTGVMIMANDGVEVEGNVIERNPTAAVLVVAFPRPFTDKRYIPLPRHVRVGANAVAGNGADPQIPGKGQLLAAFGGALPPVLWDGLGEGPGIAPGLAGLSLNLPQQGAGADQAKPAPFSGKAMPPAIDRAKVGAPAALEARVSP